jgi:hypothetical protein
MGDFNPAPAPKNNWLLIALAGGLGVAIVWVISQIF